MRQRVGPLVGDERVGDRVERKQEQRTRVRRGMPRAHGFGDGHVAYHDRVHGGAEEALDQQRGRLVGVDEIAQRAEHRGFAESLAFAEETGRRRRQSHAFALERVERVDSSLDGRVRLVGAEQVRAGLGFALAGVAIVGARALQRRHRVGGVASRAFEHHRRVFDLTAHAGQRVGELRALFRQLLEALHQLFAFLPCAFAVDVHTS